MWEVIFTFTSHPKLFVEIVLKTKTEDEDNYLDLP